MPRSVKLRWQNLGGIQALLEDVLEIGRSNRDRSRLGVSWPPNCLREYLHHLTPLPSLSCGCSVASLSRPLCLSGGTRSGHIEVWLRETRLVRRIELENPIHARSRPKTVTWSCGQCKSKENPEQNPQDLYTCSLQSCFMLQNRIWAAGVCAVC
jgi:hypothetical protein